MATLKKKTRAAHVRAKKPQSRKVAKNGKPPPALAAIEKNIAQLDVAELAVVAKKIADRKEQMLRAANGREKNTEPDDPTLGEYKWIFEQCNAGKMRRYFQQQIAVLNRKVIWSGENSLDLRDTLGKRHGVDPDRIVIFFVG